LQRWNILDDRLPPGSVVQFREPTVWERYRRPMAIATLASVAEALLVVGLAVSNVRRRRAERVVRSRDAKLRASHRRIRQLAGRLINAQEATRANIARELHDGLCQELGAVSWSLNNLKRSADADTRQALSKLETSTAAMLMHVRDMTHDLHPATLGLLGLEK